MKVIPPFPTEPTEPPPERHTLARHFSLLHDKADDQTIDTSLRAGVELTGATSWILMMAILIASIGLNTNSPAVVIGAMLVSPLMGPIVGIGYGIGILDFPLIRRSLANLGIAAGISLATSTLYFLLTPLHEAQSELLARTTPTLWDVLIALAGGLAGIIGLTRRERSNVLPGVAIATALMPPLCTAGYGLANGNWTVFGGAFYLFSINCVFIAASAVLVIEYLRLPHRKFVDKRLEKRVKRAVILVAALTALPSIYLAIQLVDNEVFKGHARAFVRREFQSPDTHVVEVKVQPASREIELTLIGTRLPPGKITAIQQRLADAGMPGTKLLVHQAEDSKIDVTSLRADLLQDLLRDTQHGIRERDATIAELRAQLERQAEQAGAASDIAHEMTAQFPQCDDALVAYATAQEAAGPLRVPLLSASCTRNLSKTELARATTWLKARTKSPQARISVQLVRR